MTRTNWVFGYGSLMWDPGFHPTEAVKARLSGYARSFCLRSTRYRGTEEHPGLVLGLDRQRDASCSGMALRISDTDHDTVMDYLRVREMDTGAYREATVAIQLDDGRQVDAIAYVMRRDHWQYAGGLCVNEQARIISRAHGGRGPNADYLFNTARHLTEIGLPDRAMNELAANVKEILASDRNN
ncbi:gamma-glutamylcyclotransferase [Paracoccus sp. Z330]|uniref:glutathione-specific gamma-glutamylcyclotransferase n=1 Tax=Paracoccus onchidii TaxID=3017813 RepID=A0ABT4ZCH1_9RHOB|nr:gamma-glutamylcyclotransferase [Paracoccus onchidii]MDB6176982.1 gamma-glutamylcyclotransferase [Paracoccus onchidii]